jgi:hypothetical protein
MGIVLLVGIIGGLILTLHLLNRRDADKLELEHAISGDPRLRCELMYARDRQEIGPLRLASAIENEPTGGPEAEEHRQAA